MSSIKTAELLRLPEDIAAFDGIIKTIRTAKIVRTRTNDFTSGRRVITDTYEIVGVSRVVNEYAINRIDWRLLDDNASLSHTRAGHLMTYEKPVNFTETGWIGGSVIGFKDGELEETKEVEFVNTVGRNVTVQVINRVQMPTATDINNPPVQVEHWEVIKTKTSTTRSRRHTSPLVPLDVILKALEMSREDLEYALREVWTIDTTPDENRIFSYAVDVDELDTRHLIVPYVNGVSIFEKRPSGMLTSYNKQWPGVQTRWIIYCEGDKRMIATGATFHIQQDPFEQKPVVFIPSSRNAVSEVENVFQVEYNAEKECMLIAQVEENPAQFKQWEVQNRYIVVDGELVRTF